MSVFVLDKCGKPLMPCSEKRARLLLERRRARVHRLVPFVIRLTDRLVANSKFQPLLLKIEPGSKVTGLALVRKADAGIAVLSLFELLHRGRQISEALAVRKNFRRRRRSANLRYRAPRFHNAGRRDGWLAPSLKHRVDSTISWVTRLGRWVPISRLASELVRFDTEVIHRLEIAGTESKPGELAGHEVREYLLEKWGHRCAYCEAQGVPFQVHRILSQAQGGTNRVSNLTLACAPCATRFSQGVRGLITDGVRVEHLLRRAKAPYADAAAVNGTRRVLVERLQHTGLPLDVSTGARTKWNRLRLGMPKSQALDAACVGPVEIISGWQRPALQIKCMGRGSYQRTRLTAQGFPRGYLTRSKRVHGFQTGDRVLANVSAGKKAGIYVGRVAVRATGSFNIQTQQGVIQGISHRHCVILQRADGYSYSM